MHISLRRAAGAVIALAFVTGMFVASPASAATPGCYESTCHGQDPAAEHCTADAVVVDSGDKDTSDGYSLYYSTACDAVWSSVSMDELSTQPSGYAQIFYAPTMGGAEAEYSTEIFRPTNGTTATVNSPMVSAPGSAYKGCMNWVQPALDPEPESVVGSTWSEDQGVCGGWH
ncbi:DUF2690 domain-containing protein [Streptomyces sp. SL13]|uniref:DUF2690 domain-containing protein n=1 Tax=Streptantibioticus silvisoli TaxID=2705255 RepID=A0AA90H9V8_9ACTN|nr:DUF2690 domain-containing protein [Streptantibioticus silvisoli]MDI5973553.1 DUF2690 domain-containing protein [Streptantibioticus silvisoli]